MRFGPVPLGLAEGQILAHNVVDENGRRILRKGRRIDATALEKLRRSGREQVTVARLEAGDVDENEAAERITARHCTGEVRLAGPSTGRVNVHATCRGVVRVDATRLLDLNRCEGVTLATLGDWSVVHPDRMVGTTKILPYGLPGELVQRALELESPTVRVLALPERRVHLIVTAGVGSRERTSSSFEAALGARIEALGSELVTSTTVDSDVQAQPELARALADARSGGAELIVVAGETAIQDRLDVAPSALEQAGGRVVCFGAPVDPGNLMLLGELDDVPVLGAPGCARSPKRNIVDLLLPRLLIGEIPTRDEILKLGHGGLLEDVGERPLPRRQIES